MTCSISRIVSKAVIKGSCRTVQAMLLFSMLLACLLSVSATNPSPAYAAAVIPTLASPSLGERWFIISMNDEKTGFGYTKITPNAGGYEITAGGSSKIAVFGFSREAVSREQYQVNKDLSLRSFSVAQTIDGKAVKLKGNVTAKGIKVVLESKGVREKLINTKGAVYPPPVLNIYPLMHGSFAGGTIRLKMLDIEAIKIKDVEISTVGLESMPDGIKLLHLQNDLYPVSNDVWVDLAGNTVRESVRDGMIETRAEQESAARKFIAEAAVAKNEFILDFSRVPVDQPIENPGKLGVLKLEITELPDDLQLSEGAGQQASRVGTGKVAVTVARGTLAETHRALPPGLPQRYLDASEWIPAGNGEIITQRDLVLKGERDPLKIVEKLDGWVAANIRDTPTDSRSPLDALASKTGSCQSHARLYVLLARAAGVPSRVVTGLVYVAGKGFLYHSWAESYAGKWIAVDPTLNEVPADATHVKLVEGDSPQEMYTVGGLIGKIKVKVIEKAYQGFGK